uniref:NADH-ubiquinone oxidoreductase chain 4 n=1 Tax=Physopelta slanbuschii TaxID=1768093 RepID=A0A4Y1JVS3_9HEMI|nr:NADH dehydrogenase subunit 4 [Physopelta slanbuschii]APO08827.1 NADH dehydrogenase subunit 4 [Physopelta slanbuschii]
MMKVLFFVLFLIPLFNYWWLFFICLLSFSLYFLSLPVFLFFSHISYGFGMDLLSYSMIFLSLWIIFLVIMASSNIKFSLNYFKEFLLVNSFLLFFLILTFSSLNLFYFYLFFESSMIPVLLLIFGWGYQPERLLSGFYLLFYTLSASLPMLLCIFYIFFVCGTLIFSLIVLDLNFVIYLCMILAFLVKMPMIFFHFWLPKAHVESPVSGSMILAGVLLKLGGYGLFRVFIFIWDYAVMFNWVWLVLSLYGSVLISIMCLFQVDIKSLIAYSSVSHMGLVICGIMTCTVYGFCGSLALMIGHGLCSSGLFVLANIIYNNSYSRSLFINSGLIVYMPSMSMFWFFFSVNNMASPMSVNLLGELLLINSIIGWGWVCFLFIFISSFFSCCYSIYLYSITQHGSLYSGFLVGNSGFLCDYLLLIYHLFPLNVLFLKIDIFILWV